MRQFVTYWLGAPYAERGRSRFGGVDCWGLVGAGTGLPDCFDYTLENSAAVIESVMHRLVDKVPLEEAAPFDVVGFDTRGDGRLWHVGLYWEFGKFIHIQDKSGVIVSRLDRQPFMRRLIGVYRAQQGAAV